MSIIVDDVFHCSRAEIEEFGKTRVWREMRSWIEQRRNGVADLIDNAKTDLEIRLLQKERQILRDLLELPDLIIATLDVRDANEEKDKEPDNVNDEQRVASNDYPG